MVAHVSNPNIVEAETGGLLWIVGQPGPNSIILSQKKRSGSRGSGQWLLPSLTSWVWSLRPWWWKERAHSRTSWPVSNQILVTKWIFFFLKKKNKCYLEKNLVDSSKRTAWILKYITKYSNIWAEFASSWICYCAVLCRVSEGTSPRHSINRLLVLSSSEGGTSNPRRTSRLYWPVRWQS